jgi:hypothetical protein
MEREKTHHHHGMLLTGERQHIPCNPLAVHVKKNIKPSANININK